MYLDGQEKINKALVVEGGALGVVWKGVDPHVRGDWVSFLSIMANEGFGEAPEDPAPIVQALDRAGLVYHSGDEISNAVTKSPYLKHVSSNAIYHLFEDVGRF